MTNLGTRQTDRLFAVAGFIVVVQTGILALFRFAASLRA